MPLLNLQIQIPALNEEELIGETIDSIPKKILGIRQITVVVIDDGSSDKTAEIARKHGADVILTHSTNRGLSAAFQSGIGYAIKSGADIVVNLDADCQYSGEEVLNLVKPIITGDLDVVIGDRQTDKIGEYSPLKKSLQRIGSRTVSRLVGYTIPDATSGFRAYSSRIFLLLHVSNKFTYTLETIVQLAAAGVNIGSIPVKSRVHLRKSRLFKSNFQYVRKNGLVLLVSHLQYFPGRLFIPLATLSLGMSLISFSPFLLDYIYGANSGGHAQSFILGVAFAIATLQFISIWFIAHSLKSIRRNMLWQNLN